MEDNEFPDTWVVLIVLIVLIEGEGEGEGEGERVESLDEVAVEEEVEEGDEDS